jgi:hypothetical protein
MVAHEVKCSNIPRITLPPVGQQINLITHRQASYVTTNSQWVPGHSFSLYFVKGYKSPTTFTSLCNHLRIPRLFFITLWAS